MPPNNIGATLESKKNRLKALRITMRNLETIAYNTSQSEKDKVNELDYDLWEKKRFLTEAPQWVIDRFYSIRLEIAPFSDATETAFEQYYAAEDEYNECMEQFGMSDEDLTEDEAVDEKVNNF